MQFGLAVGDHQPETAPRSSMGVGGGGAGEGGNVVYYIAKCQRCCKMQLVGKSV
jgi:hypothetical protein